MHSPGCRAPSRRTPGSSSAGMDVCWALPGWEGEECLHVSVLPGSSLRHTGPSTLVIKIPHQDTLQDTLKAPSPLQQPLLTALVGQEKTNPPLVPKRWVNSYSTHRQERNSPREQPHEDEQDTLAPSKGKAASYSTRQKIKPKRDAHLVLWLLFLRLPGSWD